MVELSDKKAEFSFNLHTKNAKIEDTEARLVIETLKGDRVYPITINESGYSSVEFIPDNVKSEGKIFVEVINKDFYARPWEDTYSYEGKKLTEIEQYYQKGLQKLKVTQQNQEKKEKYINILLEHTAKRYGLDTHRVLKLKRNTSNLL